MRTLMILLLLAVGSISLAHACIHTVNNANMHHVQMIDQTINQ